MNLPRSDSSYQAIRVILEQHRPTEENLESLELLRRRVEFDGIRAFVERVVDRAGGPIVLSGPIWRAIQDELAAMEKANERTNH
jgi:hypothetical protein